MENADSNNVAMQPGSIGEGGSKFYAAVLSQRSCIRNNMWRFCLPEPHQRRSLEKCVWGLTRKSSLTCRHGVPVGLNSNFGEEPPLTAKAQKHTHFVPFCLAVLPCILFVECVIASACLVIPAALWLQRWQQL